MKMKKRNNKEAERKRRQEIAKKTNTAEKTGKSGGLRTGSNAINKGVENTNSKEAARKRRQSSLIKLIQLKRR